MKRLISNILLAAGTLLSAPVMSAQATAAAKTPAPSVKAERNMIAEGNKFYRQERYSEAEVKYRKALEANPASETASFNLAAALLRQSKGKGPDGLDEAAQEATQLLTTLSRDAADVRLAELAAYNLGNLAYNSEQYQQSIDLYKQALRRNPDNDQARQNLRLAQLKLQNQNNQQDKNQDKNKEDEKEQENKDQQQQQQQQNQEKQQQQQQQQQNISDNNAEQILKAMENEEKATRARVNAQKAKENTSNQRHIAKPW